MVAREVRQLKGYALCRRPLLTKTNSLSCLPAAEAQTRRARHTETAGP